MTMRRDFQAVLYSAARRFAAYVLFKAKITGTFDVRVVCGAFALLLCCAGPSSNAQEIAQTGPHELTFAGLRSVLNSQGVPVGQINAVQVDGQGNLLLLLDQKDGVRLLKTDPAASNVLAQAQIGAQGDIGLAMALDPSGNVYVTGTSASGAWRAQLARHFLPA